MNASNPSDPLLRACEAALSEIAGYPITGERLSEALPLIRQAIAAIREMDEADVSGLEPMTIIRLST
jgi:hypothetical protein